MASDIGGVEVLSKPGAPVPGSRRKPPESMMKWTPPNVASMPPRNSEGVGRDALLRRVNSKDPQRIGSLEPKGVGDDGVGDVSENAADVTGATDDMPCADRVPTDGANCRGCSLEMPTMRGLGLTESCKLARDIGDRTNGERDLPRFGALDEVKPLLPACLNLIIEKYIGLQWGSQRTTVDSPRG